MRIALELGRNLGRRLSFEGGGRKHGDSRGGGMSAAEDTSFLFGTRKGAINKHPAH